jgi:hypothetical protein
MCETAKLYHPDIKVDLLSDPLDTVKWPGCRWRLSMCDAAASQGVGSRE